MTRMKKKCSTKSKTPQRVVGRPGVPDTASRTTPALLRASGNPRIPGTAEGAVDGTAEDVATERTQRVRGYSANGEKNLVKANYQHSTPRHLIPPPLTMTPTAVHGNVTAVPGNDTAAPLVEPGGMSSPNGGNAPAVPDGGTAVQDQQATTVRPSPSTPEVLANAEALVSEIKRTSVPAPKNTPGVTVPADLITMVIPKPADDEVLAIGTDVQSQPPVEDKGPTGRTGRAGGSGRDVGGLHRMNTDEDELSALGVGHDSGQTGRAGASGRDVGGLDCLHPPLSFNYLELLCEEWWGVPVDPDDMQVIEAEKAAFQAGSQDGFWVPDLGRWVSKERHYFPSPELEQPVREYLAEQYRRAQGHHQVDHQDELLALRMAHDSICCSHDSSQFEVAAEVAAAAAAAADVAMLPKRHVRNEVKEIWVSYFCVCFVISSFML